MELYKLMHDPEAVARLKALAEERAKSLDWKPFTRFHQCLANLPNREARSCCFDEATVRIGEKLETDDPDRNLIQQAAQAIMPWKKGPYSLFGIDIDAEWRSDFKWDRLAPRLPDQAGKAVLDVGCNNGYYLFRLLPQKPHYLLGIDPVPRLWHQFHLLQHYAKIPNLEFAMWGWQELDLWPELFDTIFCMGIIYHHPDPIGILRALYAALKPGGLLVLETIVIPGETPTCLFPPDRYARMRNVWFVPTTTATCHFLERTRFQNIRVVATNRHEPSEQRSTAWNPGPSYADFLDPNNPELTIEGHPAPRRAILLATKKG